MGIGTSAPTATFHTVSTGNAGVFQRDNASVYSGANISASFATINGNTTTSNASGIAFQTDDGSGTLKSGIQIGGVFTSRAGNNVTADYIVNTSNAGTMATKMIVKGDGNVGIGTSTPVQLLEVNGDVKITGDDLFMNTNTAGALLVADGTNYNPKVVKQEKVLPVQSAKLTGAFVTASAAIDAGDGNWRLLFDDSTTESAVWQFRMPSNYSAGLTAKLGYSMTSATADKVDLEVEVMAVTDGDAADIGSASFATLNEVSGGTTVPGTAGYLDEVSIALSNADSVAAGDLVYIRVNRDHDDADDTATGDLELVYLVIEWTM